MTSLPSHPIRRWRASLFAVVSLLGVWPFSATAAEPALVVVVPPASATADSAWDVHEALRVQLAALPNVVVLPNAAGTETAPAQAFAQARRVAAEHNATAVVWLGRDGDALYFYVWDGEAQQSLRRRLSFSGVKAQATEQTAAIVRWAIQGLLDRQVLVLEPVTDTPPPTPTPQPPVAESSVASKAINVHTPSSRHDRILLWLAYAGGRFAPTAPWHDGLLAGVGLPIGIFSMSATYKIVPTLEVNGSQAEARVSRHPFELRMLAQRRFRNFTLWGGAGVGIDASTRTTTTVGGAPLLVPAENRTSVAVGAGPQAAVSFAVQGSVNVYIGLGVDVMVRSVRYHEEANARDTVLAPYPVQARAECGLLVTL